jgi:gas vesicle protein
MSGEQRTEGAGAGAFVLAFLAGALVGAAGALLLAPRSGVEARARLAGAAGSARDRGRRIREAARAAAAAAQAAIEEAMRQEEGGSPEAGEEQARPVAARHA